MPLGDCNLQQVTLCEPADEIFTSCVVGLRSYELVEDDSVVLPEAEVRDARHVVAQRQLPSDVGSFGQRSVDTARQAMERHREWPGKAPEHGHGDPRRDLP